MFFYETAELFHKKYEVQSFEEPLINKDSFKLPEYDHQIEDEDYRFEIEINSQEYLSFAKRVNATPAILMSYLISKSIYINNSNIDKPIVCSIATDMRKELGLPHTHKNCVRSMYLSFDQKDNQMNLKELCTKYRESIAKQRDLNYVKQTANMFSGMNDKLDQLKTMEEKKKIMSFYDTMTINSFVLSYLGTFDLGECNQFIDAIHFYSGGIKGIKVNMTATSQSFNITFIQNIETEKYVRSFIQLLKELKISYCLNDKIRFSTTKDKTQKTAHYQSERFQIKS